MKKILLFVVAITLQLTGLAQEIVLNESGAYEKKEVVEVDSVKASVLYDRAMVALSEWTGADGRSKAGLDYHERDAGTVIYKGKYFLNSKNGVVTVANFTLKVRCKDGRAQVTVTIPSMTAVADRLNMERTATLEQVKSNPKRGAYAFLPKIPEMANVLIDAMNKGLMTVDDDDF